VALDPSYNAEIAKQEIILRKMHMFSDKIDSGDHDVPYNYDFMFPEIVETIVLSDRRQVSVIAFKAVDDVSTMVPLIKIPKAGLRVDLRTSAWIFGKLLKLIHFAHMQNIQVNNVFGNNVLIERDQHFVMLFNWSEAEVHTNLSSKNKKGDISKAARCIIKVVGGADNGHNLAFAHETPHDNSYTEYISYLARGREDDAQRAHTNFYQTVRALQSNPASVWEPGFYPFKTHEV